MVQENIAVGNWTQTHDQIYLNSRGGAIMLDSSKPNGMIKLLADTTLGLATSQAGIYVDSTTRDTPAPSLSGSIAVIAEGVTPAVRLAAVPSAPDANGSVLTLGTTGAVLSTGIPTTGSKLQLGPQSASIISAMPGAAGSITITPEAITISIGQATFLMTPTGILLSVGSVSFNLNASGIAESAAGTTTRLLSPTSGNMLASDLMNQLKTVENIFAVSPAGVQTTAATEDKLIDGASASDAPTVEETADAEKTTTAATLETL